MGEASLQDEAARERRARRRLAARRWLRVVVATLLVLAVMVGQAFVVAAALFAPLDELSLTVVYEAGGVVLATLAVCVMGGAPLFELHAREVLAGLRSCRYMILCDASLAVVSIASSLHSGSAFVADWPWRLALVTLMCLGVGVFEELAFRALPVESLLGPLGGSRAGVAWTCVVTSVGFGLAHVLPADLASLGPLEALQMLLKVVQTGVCGMLWAAVLVRDRTIWGVALGHALTDLPLMLSTVLFTTEGVAADYISSGDDAMALVATYLFVIALYLPLFFKSVRILRQVPVPVRGTFDERARERLAAR